MTHRRPRHVLRLAILDAHTREYEATLRRVAEQMEEPKVKEKCTAP